ncbi:hypothetical protein [Saccharopolyspora phatthalungensis]|uniref:Uncharacterized protein n=1 Tax=Saccharopolyspora phatthalungensis TaxID=664693 RepID=A0A840QEE6_9PSEU|nr:hypothetical protein [Saccharopolyspora phatthalungensis]MBB5156949.1 hypothetical protein [Saccharopolyspora phatthalungensis]
MSDPGHELAVFPPGTGYSPSKMALNAITVQYAKELLKSGILQQRTRGREPRTVGDRLDTVGSNDASVLRRKFVVYFDMISWWRVLVLSSC